MDNTKPSPSFWEPQIYTLAQSGTNDNSCFAGKPNKMVYGNGSDQGNKKAQKGKAKRKYITQYMTRCLAAIATEKGDAKRAQAYWNAFHCQSQLIKANGRTYGNYCKNRWCLICLANRKADIINRYYPTLAKWEDPHFVTLTMKAVPAPKLNWMIKTGIIRAFKIIRERLKKRHQRGKGPKLMGIKSLECNYNPVKQTYNPHYHIIVPNRALAVLLKKEWLLLWTSDYTYHAAQHIRKVGNLQRDLVETIKYGSKIFTEPDMKKKAKHKIPPMIYAAALDNIFVAIKGHRLFDRFGFNLPKQGKGQKGRFQIVVDYAEISYDANSCDWLDYESGELLTGYVPTGQLSYLLEHNIDVEKG